MGRKRKAMSQKGVSKRRKVSGTRTTKTSIRKALLGLAETKRMNVSSQLNTYSTESDAFTIDLKHNAISSDGHTFVPSSAVNTNNNLVFTEQGSDAHNRNGEEIFVSKLHMKWNFQAPNIVLVGQTSDAYPSDIKVRVIVVGGDRAVIGSANWSNIVLQSPQLYTDNNKLMCDVDTTRFKVYYDKRHTVKANNIVYQGTATDEYNFMPSQYAFDKVIKLNKKFKYTQTDNVTEHRLAWILVAYNDNTLGNGTIIGKARYAHTLYFKDV